MHRTLTQGPSQRQKRVAEEIRHILADSLARDEFYDKVLSHTHITITRVSASPDLKQARVYIMLLGGGDEKAVLAALKEKAPHFRSILAKSLTIKFIPKVIFALDDVLEKSLALEALFHSNKVAQDLEPHDTEDA